MEDILLIVIALVEVANLGATYLIAKTVMKPKAAAPQEKKLAAVPAKKHFWDKKPKEKPAAKPENDFTVF